MMMLLVAAAMLPTPAPRTNLTDALYGASAVASGDRLCDRKRAAEQKAKFDALYGARIDRLRAAYLSWHGPDPELVKVMDCRGSDSSRERKTLKDALLQFDISLKLLESKYAHP